MDTQHTSLTQQKILITIAQGEHSSNVHQQKNEAHACSVLASEMNDTDTCHSMLKLENLVPGEISQTQKC